MSSIIEFKLSLYVDDLLLYCMLWKSISTLYGSFFGCQKNLSKSEYYLAHVQLAQQLSQSDIPLKITATS